MYSLVRIITGVLLLRIHSCFTAIVPNLDTPSRKTVECEFHDSVCVKKDENNPSCYGTRNCYDEPEAAGNLEAFCFTVWQNGTGSGADTFKIKKQGCLFNHGSSQVLINFRLYKQYFKNLLHFDVYPPEISDWRIDKEFFYYFYFYYLNPWFVLVKRWIRTRPADVFLKVFTSSKILLIFYFFTETFYNLIQFNSQ